MSSQPPACWIYGSLPSCGVLRGLCGSGVMGSQRPGFLCTLPNLSVTSGGRLLGIKKIKYQGQYADYIFMLLIQIQNFPHGAGWRIFRGKRKRPFQDQPGKEECREGAACPSSLALLLRRVCACVSVTPQSQGVAGVGL